MMRLIVLIVEEWVKKEIVCLFLRSHCTVLSVYFTVYSGQLLRCRVYSMHTLFFGRIIYIYFTYLHIYEHSMGLMYWLVVAFVETFQFPTKV